MASLYDKIKGEVDQTLEEDVHFFDRDDNIMVYYDFDNVHPIGFRSATGLQGPVHVGR